MPGRVIITLKQTLQESPTLNYIYDIGFLVSHMIFCVREAEAQEHLLFSKGASFIFTFLNAKHTGTLNRFLQVLSSSTRGSEKYIS